MNRPYPRTVSTYRRDLLAALRQIRDEGPTKRHLGLIGNLVPLMRPNKQENIWTYHLYNGYLRIVGDPFPHPNRDKWVNNPRLLEILHRMIRHMENNHFYLGTDL